MTGYVLGFVLSIGASVLLLTLFRHEERVGVRFCAPLRNRLDYYVLRTMHLMDRFFRLVGRDSMRQLFHYILHTVLRLVLQLNRRWEQSLRNMIRVNKTLARDVDRGRTTRTKLEKVALHKIKNTLTEEEKRKRRDMSLEG